MRYWAHHAFHKALARNLCSQTQEDEVASLACSASFSTKLFTLFRVSFPLHISWNRHREPFPNRVGTRRTLRHAIGCFRRLLTRNMSHSRCRLADLDSNSIGKRREQWENSVRFSPTYQGLTAPLSDLTAHVAHKILVHYISWDVCGCGCGHKSGISANRIHSSWERIGGYMW